jgi:hypothetical protein
VHINVSEEHITSIFRLLFDLRQQIPLKFDKYIYPTTRLHIAEDLNLHMLIKVNLKFKFILVFNQSSTSHEGVWEFEI